MTESWSIFYTYSTSDSTAAASNLHEDRALPRRSARVSQPQPLEDVEDRELVGEGDPQDLDAKSRRELMVRTGFAVVQPGHLAEDGKRPAGPEAQLEAQHL